MMRSVALLWIGTAIMVTVSSMAYGQAYPSKPIRIFTSNAGGGSDFISRLIAQGISGPLGQPVLIENRGGLIAAENVAKAAPDGYTLLVNASTWYVSSLLLATSYDPQRDFSAITITSSAPNVLAVHPSLPVKNVKELIALAKARPGELNNSRGGIGGASHLAGELFKSMTRINIVGVPYKGSAPTVIAVLVGDVQLTFVDYEPVQPHIKSGKLRALAVTSMQPSELFPGLPPIAATVPGYVAITNTGVLAPAKTPTAVIIRLNQEIVRVLKTPEARAQFLRTGSEVVASSPEELAAWIKADMVLWNRVIKDAGIRAD